MNRCAPKPHNFQALADAWNDPDAFARELNAYYAQLANTEPPALTCPAQPKGDSEP